MHVRETQLVFGSIEDDTTLRLTPGLWRGSFNTKESSIQQLAPYVGKMKSGMARALVLAYSSPGDVVLDPFCGSGVVTYEALVADRHALGNDLNVYAYTLTLGKLSAPITKRNALGRAKGALDAAERDASKIDLARVPSWVRQFFHPKTLQEIIALFGILRHRRDYFLQACLLGILHHVRPGFLSYPASHLVPYLRTKQFPPDKYPRMYRYRDVRSRLMAKIERAYRRHVSINPDLRWQVLKENAMSLGIADASVNAIVSSPPYFGALDYGRDNRLRLWFLGVENYKELDEQLTSSDQVYVPQMRRVVREMYRVLQDGGPAVLVLGDYQRNGGTKDSAITIAQLAQEEFNGGFYIEDMIRDAVPDERRTRRRTRTTLQETILVLRKKMFPKP